MRAQAVATDQWMERRRRAAELKERWPFASEVLTFYGALVDVQERVARASHAELSDPSLTVAYVIERVLPLVRETTIASGPEKLALAVAEGAAANWEEKLRSWLGGEELSAADCYLVRAAAGPVLEVLGPAVRDLCAGPRNQRHCSRCGGLPQVSILASSGEDLVAPGRYLECSRCAWRWPYPRMTCAACGETETRHLLLLAEEGTTEAERAGTVVRGVSGAPAAAPPQSAPRFPHASIHACKTCSRYLLNIDLSRDARAVPVVDELALIPLDLYAGEQAFTKIVPNLMGL